MCLHTCTVKSNGEKTSTVDSDNDSGGKDNGNNNNKTASPSNDFPDDKDRSKTEDGHNGFMDMSVEINNVVNADSCNDTDRRGSSLKTKKEKAICERKVHLSKSESTYDSSQVIYVDSDEDIEVIDVDKQKDKFMDVDIAEVIVIDDDEDIGGKASRNVSDHSSQAVTCADKINTFLSHPADKSTDAHSESWCQASSSLSGNCDVSSELVRTEPDRKISSIGSSYRAADIAGGNNVSVPTATSEIEKMLDFLEKCDSQQAPDAASTAGEFDPSSCPSTSWPTTEGCEQSSAQAGGSADQDAVNLWAVDDQKDEIVGLDEIEPTIGWGPYTNTSPKDHSWYHKAEDNMPPPKAPSRKRKPKGSLKQTVTLKVPRLLTTQMDQAPAEIAGCSSDSRSIPPELMKTFIGLIDPSLLQQGTQKVSSVTTGFEMNHYNSSVGSTFPNLPPLPHSAYSDSANPALPPLPVSAYSDSAIHAPRPLPVSAYSDSAYHALCLLPASAYSDSAYHAPRPLPTRAYSDSAIHAPRPLPVSAYSDSAYHALRLLPAHAYSDSAYHAPRPLPARAYSDSAIHALRPLPASAYSDSAIHAPRPLPARAYSDSANHAPRPLPASAYSDSAIPALPPLPASSNLDSTYPYPSPFPTYAYSDSAFHPLSAGSNLKSFGVPQDRSGNIAGFTYPVAPQDFGSGYKGSFVPQAYNSAAAFVHSTHIGVPQVNNDAAGKKNDAADSYPYLTHHKVQGSAMAGSSQQTFPHVDSSAYAWSTYPGGTQANGFITSHSKPAAATGPQHQAVISGQVVPGKGPKMGPDHQADIPDLVDPKKDDAPRDLETLLWDPSRAEDVDGGSTLLKNESSPPKWDMSEIQRFNRAMIGFKFKRPRIPFSKVQQAVGTRSLKEVIDFYYHWKSSEKFGPYEVKMMLLKGQLEGSVVNEMEFNMEHHHY